MSSQSETLTCHLYTAVMNAERFGATLDAIESLLPTPPLNYRIDQVGHIHEVAQPAAWLAEQFAAGESTLVCNGDESQLVTLSAHDMLQVPPVVQLSLHLDSVEYFDHAFELIRHLGVIVDAFYGSAQTVTTGSRIVGEYLGDLTTWLPPTATMVPPPLPPVISWIMYWSAETCELFDFNPGDPRAELFIRCVACDRDAVMVQLTEEPVDLGIPAHCAAVDAAYDAFPQIPQCARTR